MDKCTIGTKSRVTSTEIKSYKLCQNLLIVRKPNLKSLQVIACI